MTKNYKLFISLLLFLLLFIGWFYWYKVFKIEKELTKRCDTIVERHEEIFLYSNDPCYSKLKEKIEQIEFDCLSPTKISSLHLLEKTDKCYPYIENYLKKTNDYFYFPNQNY